MLVIGDKEERVLFGAAQMRVSGSMFAENEIIQTQTTVLKAEDDTTIILVVMCQAFIFLRIVFANLCGFKSI